MPILAALRAAVFKLFAKNRWGGQNLPTPSSTRVITFSISYGDQYASSIYNLIVMPVT